MSDMEPVGDVVIHLVVVKVFKVFFIALLFENVQTEIYKFILDFSAFMISNK